MKINHCLLNENTIEQLAIQTLQKQGWRYVVGREIAVGGEGDNTRKRADSVILPHLLRQSLIKLNPTLPEETLDEVVQTLEKLTGETLSQVNAKAYAYLRNGVNVKYQQDGQEIYDVAQLVDFHHLENNDFVVVNQLSIQGKKGMRRPDMIAYVNGLPMAVFELKNPLDEKADIYKAFCQLQTYKDEIPSLFYFNQVLVVADGTQARLGSLTADFERFTPWRVVLEKNQSQRLHFEQELQGLLQGLFEPKNFLDYVQNFVIFEPNEKGKMVKKIGAYHQFYGVNEALDSTLLAHTGNKKIGVVWHTQGSGKSLSMLFYAGKVSAQIELGNPTLVIVTDRNDLDNQLYQTFCGGKTLLKQSPVRAESRQALREELAKRQTGGVIFTTIQKFALNEDETNHPLLNDRHNIIVITDEAHRSQYGFNKHINNKGLCRAGFAQHLRQALPNASFIGFTGTPIAKEDKDTQEVFGKYVSIYDFQDAVEDGATVPIIYEARQIPLSESEEYQQVMEEAKSYLAQTDENDAHWRLREKLMGTESRLQKLANDFVSHFEKRNEIFLGKAMLVAMSREICVKLYEEIIKLRPHWHNDDVMAGEIKIVMTSNASDPQSWQKHNQDKEILEKRFKDPDDPLKVVIVRDMWLTGFDAPCCHTMYIDKPMKGHNLMQAIARVNRVFRNKSRENGGLIVDYVGLTEELRDATQTYTNAKGKGEVKRDIDTILSKMLEQLTVLREQFATPVNNKVFPLQDTLALTDSALLLERILQGANHILALDHQCQERGISRKKAFLENIRSAKKGFALCGALPKAQAYQQELAFFDAVRATILKNSVIDGQHSAQHSQERQLKLVQLLNRAVKSEEAVDLFEVLELQRPNISLLSDEFLNMVQKSQTKDLWAVAVERYLKNKISEKSGTNLSTQREFSKRLKEAMNQYHNHNLSVMDVLEELIELAKELEARSLRGEALGLNDAELAFYDALAKNDSAQNLMGEMALIKLAKEITDKLRKSATIDWQYKDAVKAKMRILVRRILMIHKYPPDAQTEAIAYVLEQAEVIADDLI